MTSPAFAFSAGAPEAEGTWRYRALASDGTLTSAFSSGSALVKVDRTAPLAPTASADRSPEYPGDGGWYRDTVTVSFAANGDPALPDASAGAGVDAGTLSAAQLRNTSGSHTLSGTVSDGLGNTSGPGSLTVKVDATDPVVSIACPATDPFRGATATARWTASDAHSGLAGAASGTVALDTATVGAHTAAAPMATDNVGRTGAAGCTYTVRENAPPPPPPPPLPVPLCANAATGLATGTRVGAARLGRRRAEVRALIRGVTAIAPGLDAACVLGGALRIGYPTSSLLRGRSPALARAVRGRAVLLLSTSPRSSLRGLRPGDREARLRRTVPHREPASHRPLALVHRQRATATARVPGEVGRVRAVGVADTRLTRGRAAQARFLRAWPLR